MFNFSEMERIKNIIRQGAETSMTDRQFLEREIQKFKASDRRKLMITGEGYYEGEHDILERKRTVIGETGEPEEVTNLPNNKIVDNQYGKMVDQKVNYLLGKPFTIETENTTYAALLKDIFNMRFHRTIKNVGENSLNNGIAWLHPYYDDNGDLHFKKFESYEILPFWKDAEHTLLDVVVRIFTVEAYEGNAEVKIEKVEVYSTNGVDRYVLVDGTLIPDVENPSSAYIIESDGEGDKGWNWTKVPIIAFKYNNKEIPLIKRVKSLQDGINTIISDFENNMQEDARNTILVLQNYDGENLGEFRRNLATYGAVKVKTVEGAAGDLRTLTITVNSENYKVILDIFKKALVENAKGYDMSEMRSGTPNEMNIKSIFNDIDLDANGMETEYQAAMEELLWFINVHLANNGKGDFEKEKVKIIFNRDMVVNESQTILDVKNSVGVLSEESLIGQHPWVTDPKEELKRVKAEQKVAMDQYANNMPNGGDVNATK